MRDINRIADTMMTLESRWRIYFPDWRFMQFICNFQSWMNSDCFYMEEDELLEKMQEFCIQSAQN